MQQPKLRPEPEPRPWLAHYPPGVPREIAAPAESSLAELLLTVCARHRERVALRCGEQSLRYADLEQQSERLAAYLASRDLAKGERVALMCPNLPQLPIAMLAAHRLGLIVVNVNPMYTARELKHQLVDSGAVAIVLASTVLPTFEAVAAETLVQLCVVVDGAPMSAAETGAGRGRVSFIDALQCTDPLPEVRVGHEDLAFLQYTGGTTGTSKGAMLSHGNVLCNVAQSACWLAPKDERPLAVITALPLYHIFALTVNALLFLSRGAELVLITSPRDLNSLIAAMRAHPPGFITGVNTLFNAIAEHPLARSVDFSRLHAAVGGGTAIQAAASRRWQALTGKPIVQGYGLSETSPVLTLCDPAADFDGSIGYPPPSTELEIRDPHSGEPLPVGERGELCARGPQVMRGYWNKPEVNATAFHAGGWFRTGDVATMDERGAFTIVDRTKDMVLVSGFNVYPNEIEAVCAEHPGVIEAACIGVPDQRTGEAVKAFIVRRNPALHADELIEHCRLHLTAYKVPKQIEFVAELPKSPVGKILRRELRRI